MNRFWQYLENAYFIIPNIFRKKIKWSLFLTLLNGLLDIISLAVLIPVILIFLNPTQIQSNQTLFSIYEQLNFSTQLTFQITILSAIVALFVLKNFISVLVNYYISKTVFDISTSLSRKSFQSFFNQSYLEFTKCNSAITSRKIKTIPHDFANYILIPQLNIMAEFIVAGIIIVALSLYHPVICLLLITVLLPVLLSWEWFRKRHLARVEDDFRNKYPVSLKYLLLGIDSYIDVKLYKKEGFFIERFIRMKREMNRNYAYLKTVSFLPPKILEVVLVISIALIFGYSVLSGSGERLIPLLSLFIAGFYRLYPSVTKIINGLTTINAYSYVLDELKSTEVNDDKNNDEQISFVHEIRFEKLSYSYRGKDKIFNELNLEIRHGQCIAVCGESGSGKTTLVKLLTGLLLPDSGQIFIDDEVFSQKHLSDWLSKIGYLQQQPIIIDATLEENIAFGEHKINHDKLDQVIQQVNLKDFVASLPDGLSTYLGENGLQISGGQRQRIALARALYRNSELFIFDEISNNLDKTNLLEINKSIINLLETGKTVILIDHDPIMLKIADKCWEISGGAVKEINRILVHS